MIFETIIKRQPKELGAPLDEDDLDDPITMEQDKVRKEQALLRQRRKVVNEDE